MVLYNFDFENHLVMSDQEVLVGKRKINRLNLDSEEEARVQAEEEQRLEEIRLKKEEKRRRKEQEARQAELALKQQEELERHYQDPLTMLEPDSDSHDTFNRAEKKIKKAYPDFKHSKQQMHHKRRHVSESEESSEQESEEEDSSGSEEESQQTPKRKKEIKAKKEKKEKRREQSEQLRASRHRNDRVKVQEKDPKELLVGEVAVRWWYCLPEWPPLDYDYESQLKKQGYRLVQNSRFRMQQNLVNGLYKATPLQGYVGVFRSKQKILDLRPKESCPSLQFLRNKSIQELTELLQKALKEQINALKNQKYQGTEDIQLQNELTRKLSKIS